VSSAEETRVDHVPRTDSSDSPDIVVLFPFDVPVYIPRPLSDAAIYTLSAVRFISPQQDRSDYGSRAGENNLVKPFLRLDLPMNYVTAPLIADLFLLAISAIGRQEVYNGTIGADNITPFDIILVFLSLGYIANSLEASGLIKYLVFKVLQRAGSVGHRLYAYLYPCFFGIGIFIGNDPIMVLFLSYMNRIASNIVHPRAWIHTQFAVANIATALLVTSNPANLVLAGAFNIKFVTYTANMVLPVLAMAILLLPILLYIVFADESLIPLSIKLHEIPYEARAKPPRNVNLPVPRIRVGELEDHLDESKGTLSIEEILNPYLDKGSAAFGAIVMVSTVIILLVLNAVYLTRGGHSDYWVALPAAFVMFFWDLAFGWYHRLETREIARKALHESELARAERTRAERVVREMEEEERAGLKLKDEQCISSLEPASSAPGQFQSQNGAISGHDNIGDTDEITQVIGSTNTSSTFPTLLPSATQAPPASEKANCLTLVINYRLEPFSIMRGDQPQNDREPRSQITELENKRTLATSDLQNGPPQELPDTLSSGEKEMQQVLGHTDSIYSSQRRPVIKSSRGGEKKSDLDAENNFTEDQPRIDRHRPTLTSLVADAYLWSQMTFPTATVALANLPFALVPFAFSMFVLVQALVHKGWVPVFAHGWDHWVNKTGTVGSIFGMGLLSTILCNVSFYI
jgi:Na+/H+ antiporter NhaD/arsenite permease-like protein